MRRFDSGRPLQAVMARAVVLSKIVPPLRSHVQAGLAQPRRSASAAASQQAHATPLHQWPALLQLAVLRGEGVLRDRFFGIFLSGLPAVTEPDQALGYWARFVQDPRHIQDLVQRIGLGAAAYAQANLSLGAVSGSGAITRTAHITQSIQEAHNVHANRQDPYHAIYCALLHELHQAAHGHGPDAPACQRLLGLACESFFMQLWRQQFPQGVAVQAVAKQDLTSLKQRLVVALQRRHRGGVVLRESFKTIAPDAACQARAPNEPQDAPAPEILRFTLQAKIAGHWQVLCILERPRLKTARLAAYQQALQEALDGLRTSVEKVYAKNHG